MNLLCWLPNNVYFFSRFEALRAAQNRGRFAFNASRDVSLVCNGDSQLAAVGRASAAWNAKRRVGGGEGCVVLFIFLGVLFLPFLSRSFGCSFVCVLKLVANGF